MAFKVKDGTQEPDVVFETLINPVNGNAEWWANDVLIAWMDKESGWLERNIYMSEEHKGRIRGGRIPGSNG